LEGRIRELSCLRRQTRGNPGTAEKKGQQRGRSQLPGEEIRGTAAHEAVIMIRKQIRKGRTGKDSKNEPTRGEGTAGVKFTNGQPQKGGRLRSNFGGGRMKRMYPLGKEGRKMCRGGQRDLGEGQKA